MTQIRSILEILERVFVVLAAGSCRCVAAAAG